MKLRYSPTSPYVRKVTALLIEAGLEDRVERVPTNAWDPATNLLEVNPLGKVPTLVTDDGLVLVESAIICEYLDSLPHDGPRLFPPEGAARWAALHLRGLADGIVDAGVNCLLESRRPESERSQAWMERQQGKVLRGLDCLAKESSGWGEPVTIGLLAVGCLLGYLDFRFPQEDWRRGRDDLASWYEGFAARPSMVATVPREP